MIKVIQLQEQLKENTILHPAKCDAIVPCMNNGQEVVFDVKRGKEKHELCLKLRREDNNIIANGSYFVGIDWIKEYELAVQVSPKMNDGFEVDYVRMLNEALCESDNFSHLDDLLTIRFNKSSIYINQQQDLLSVFLITEYLNILQSVIRKGLKKSFYSVEDNLKNKVKGRVLIGRNIYKNLTKGRLSDNVCNYQVYDIDSPENRILKKALAFSKKQLLVYKKALDVSSLEKKAAYIKPYFENVSDRIDTKSIKEFKGNPVFKEYNLALRFAQLLLRRFSYDITTLGENQISTPPFWIDLSKLFELYVFSKLRQIFTGKNEVMYHVTAHRQELDYLLNPMEWMEPYIIDAKYKPQYKESIGIYKEDAREVCGYSRLSGIYNKLGLNEDVAPPIKCLIIYPDQEQKEMFTFTRLKEPNFDQVTGYVRIYKIGIKLPVIKK